MKRTIPAGRIALATWMAAAVLMTVVMSVCDSCGATPAAAAKMTCASAR